jgi:hypothetical protein
VQVARQRKNQSRNGPSTYNSRELRLLEQLLLRSAPPPQWRAVIPQSRIVRLGAIAAQSEFDFTVSSLMFFQCVATSATVVATLAYSVRLRRIRIWFLSPSLATATTATVEWNTGGTGFSNTNTSVSVVNASTTEWACLDTRPPLRSLQGWYQGGATAPTNVLFSCSIPAGGIIEFEYDWVPNLTEASLGNATVSGATTGIVYCRGINTNILALPPLNSAI